MAYLATVLLLVVSIIGFSLWWSSRYEKDAGQSGKQIEITDVTGQKVTLKTSRTRSSSTECFWWCVLDCVFALQGKDVAKTIVGIDPYLSKLRTDMWDRYKSEVPRVGKILLIGNVNDKHLMWKSNSFKPRCYFSCL